jgi:uncharacterized protein YjiS (DUF1127 family)
MNSSTYVRDSAVGTPALHEIRALIESVVGAVRRWHETSRTFNELAGLDDAMLKDIGICRSEIRMIARLSATDPYFNPRNSSR